ncbi:hypothetical protein RJT34_23591 [Clitoria ternatea]|uniref:PROP1-like PPR domain-containing protein n=1 Tax=Clitoria ternatea TaxID=43366 RepID=A0AAN9IHB8_CLITE
MSLKLQLLYPHTTPLPNANGHAVFPQQLTHTARKHRAPLPNGTTTVKRDTHLKKRRQEKNPEEGSVRKSPTEQVHTKCSTKWASYGGCIPAILRALETVRDVGKALEPWEERLNNKERSIILKEQLRWDRALEIFQWFNKKGHELNVIHYNIMLRTVGKARQWTCVESLWNEMNAKGIVATNSTYGTLIDVYSKGGLREDALFWLDMMLGQGMVPDEVTMVIVVQLYKKAGEFQKAEEFFQKWSLGKPLGNNGNSVASVRLDERVSCANTSLSSHTYNTLIDTYGKAGQLKEASQTFVEMLKRGVSPTTVTFNTMIHICGNHGRLEEVSLLLRKMEELRCSPNTRTYNILISLFAKHDDIDMATKYFKTMKEACLEPDLVSYRTLLYAYSIRKMVREAEKLIIEMDGKGLVIDQYTQSALTRMYIEAGMLERSLLWFQRFHLAGNMTPECYAANIDAYGELGHILEAEKVFSWCQEQKKHLSVLQFNVMIKAYGIGKCYAKACQLFDSMEKHGVVADRYSYSSLIQILASADQPHFAKPYLRKMQEAGLASDCIPYCAVISSFVRLGQLEMAEDVYKEMVRHGVQPDVILYGILINVFSDAGRVKEAISYVDEMKQAGLPGNSVIYNSLIKLYAKMDNLEKAQEVYKLLESSKEGPTVFSSNCMIDLYVKRSMVDQAKEIFETLRKNGAANEFTFAMMLCLYKNIERFDEAIQTANQMRKLGLLTDSLSYNNALDLYAIAGRPKEAIETYREMVRASIQVDDCSFRSLGTLLLRYGVSRQAVGKLKVLMEKDANSGLQAWVSALSNVIEVYDYDTVDHD